jgi:hypothetical protein
MGSNTAADEVTRDPGSRERIEHEVADVAVTLLLFCERTGISLLDAVDRKIQLNERKYPVAFAKGNYGRPEPKESPVESSAPRIYGVDWSGDAGGGRKTIWVAEVRNGALTRLENGRSREEVTEFLIGEAQREPSLIARLDFAFAFPRWFSEKNGVRHVRDLWALTAREGERWLQNCEPPFRG